MHGRPGSLLQQESDLSFLSFKGHKVDLHLHLFLEVGACSNLAPKEQRPRLCAVITVVCVLIAVGIGVGLYFSVFSGRGADTGAKGEAASTVGS